MKKTLLIIFVLAIMLPLQVAAAQEISMAEQANQKMVRVDLSSPGQAFVEHVVAKSSAPRQIDLISGEKINIEITGPDGGETPFATINGERGVLFMPSEEDRVVKYELVDELVQQENGLWVFDFLYLESTVFIFPESIDMIFVDDKPVMLDENRGIKCHGCQMVLHFFEDTSVQTERVVWEGREFEVPIISLVDIGPFEFDQPAKTISYDIAHDNEFVTMILPFELLWEPYQVYLGDEKIAFHSYVKNDTHVWLSVRPDTAGTVSVIGTTAVPEFSMFLPLVLGITLIVALQLRGRVIPR